MLLRITLKDPDRVGDAVQQAVQENVRGLSDLTAAEKDVIMDVRMEDTWTKLDEFIEYQEYVTIEIDTDAGTTRVVPVSEV